MKSSRQQLKEPKKLEILLSQSKVGLLGACLVTTGGCISILESYRTGLFTFLVSFLSIPHLHSILFHLENLAR